jgi:hypothetical protein
VLAISSEADLMAARIVKPAAIEADVLDFAVRVAVLDPATGGSRRPDGKPWSTKTMSGRVFSAGFTSIFAVNDSNIGIVENLDDAL